MAFSDNSTTNTTTYGCVTIKWDVSFRSPLTYGNPLGASAPRSLPFPQDVIGPSGSSTPIKVTSDGDEAEVDEKFDSPSEKVPSNVKVVTRGSVLPGFPPITPLPQREKRLKSAKQQSRGDEFLDSITKPAELIGGKLK